MLNSYLPKFIRAGLRAGFTRNMSDSASRNYIAPTSTTQADYGPTAALLWTLPPFRARLFRYLDDPQLCEALTWSRSSYAEAAKARYSIIRLMRYRRYQPSFSDPVCAFVPTNQGTEG
jgi:hypothetical protein